MANLAAQGAQPGERGTGVKASARPRFRLPWLRPFLSILAVVAAALATYLLLYANGRVQDRVKLGFALLDGTSRDVAEGIAAHRSALANPPPTWKLPKRSAPAGELPAWLATTKFDRVVRAHSPCRSEGPWEIYAVRTSEVCLVSGSAPLEIAVVEGELVGFLRLSKLVGPRPRVFDGVVLADRQGNVLYRSNGLPPLERIGEENSAPSTTGAGAAGEQTAGAERRGALFDPLGWGALPRVDAGGKRYVQQCVPAIFPELTGSEKLRACGLVEEGTLRRHALALSPLASTWMFALVGSLFLALPYVKVRYMGRRERLLAADMQLLAASGLLVAGLGTLLLLQVAAAGRMQARVDGRLERFVEDARDRFDREIEAAYSQLDEASKHLAEARDPTLTPAVLLKPPIPFAYPFFEAIALTDGARQTRKWMTRVEPTPLHPVDVYSWYESASRLTEAAGKPFVFDQTIAKTSTLNLAILAVPRRSRPGEPRLGPSVPLVDRAGLAVLATPLLSVQKAVTPHPFELLVVTRNGEVAFRSDQIVRRLTRFDESWAGAGPMLVRAGLERATHPSDHAYQGRTHRLSAIEAGKVDATLVAFYDRRELDRMTAQATRGPLLMLFMLTAAILLAVGCGWLSHRDALRWAWPTEKRDRLYSLGTLGFLILGALMLSLPRLAQAAALRPFVLHALFVLPPIAVGLLCWLSVFERAKGAVTAQAERATWLPSWYPSSYVAFGVTGLVSLVAIPVWVVGRDSIEAHDRAYIRAVEREDARSVRKWWERFEHRVAAVAEPDDRISAALSGEKTPIPAQEVGEYETKASEFGCHLEQRSHCDRPNTAQPFDPRPLSCVFPLSATSEERASFHFSAPLAVCWSWLTGRKLDRQMELASVARSSGSAPPQAAPLYTFAQLLGALGLLGLLGWLVHSTGLQILGLDLEGDGVVDRSDAIGKQAKKFLLLRPSRAELDDARAQLGIAGSSAEVVDLGEPGASRYALRVAGPLVVTHLERVLDDPEWCATLRALLTSPRKDPVLLASEIDPLHYFVSRLRDADEVEARELGREATEWAAALTRGERIRFRLPPPVPAPSGDVENWVWAECYWSAHLRALRPQLEHLASRDGLDRKRTIDLALDLAEPYYRVLWQLCSLEERLVLRQLADEGVVNPRCFDVLHRLRRRRLIRVDPRFRLASESFRRFVREAESDATISRWEHPDGERGSVRIRGPLLAVGVLAAVLLAAAQDQDVLAIVSVAAGAVPVLKSIAGAVRSGPTVS